MTNKKNTKFLSILGIFLFAINFYGQEIKGTVKDSIGNPISYASVLLKKGESIKSYAYTNEQGNYSLQTQELGNYDLHFSSMSYEKKIVPIQINENTKTIEKNIVLKYKAMELDEVIIHAERDIKVKEDTVVISVKNFLQGNEDVAEDVLKKIPGVEVEENGTVKVKGKEVEKIMVEGDDFFEKGYRILTKNMPSSPIEKVEIYEHYSDNKLLKGVENSENVALNLILKEDAKRQWFGNFNIGLAASDRFRYESQFNLMNFGKKNKYYFLGNANNIGNDATGAVEHLIRPFRLNKIDKIGEDVYATKFLNLSMQPPGFKENRSNFNNAELLSLNAIFNPSKKTKIKTLGFFNWDENDFYKNSSIRYNLPDNNFTNTENYHLRKKKNIAFGKIELKHDLSKTEMLELISSYNNGWEKAKGNLVFNAQNNIENIDTENVLFNQEITYTNKFQKKKAFLLKGRFIYENTPQHYHINQFLFQDLFPYENANNITQAAQNKVQYGGLEAHLLDRKSSGNLFEVQLGNQFKKDFVNSTLFIKENNTILETPFNFQNRMTYSVNDSYLKGKFLYKKIKNIGISTGIEFHQLYNKLENFGNKKEQTPFFVNPKLQLQWEFLKKHKFSGSFFYNSTNATIQDVYDNYILTSFRNFSKGTNDFNQLHKSRYNFTYTYGNWSDNFIAYLFITYLKSHDYFSSRSQIEQNYSFSEKIFLTRNRDLFVASSTIDRYLKFISSNLKLKLNYSRTSYLNEVNNSDLRKVISSNYGYGVELRSGFKGFFNYHIGTSWNTTEIKTTIKNDFTDNVSFIDLNFNIHENFYIMIQNERYYYGSLDKENNTYYFSDITARYTVKKNKLSFELSGKNLTNTKVYRTYYADDISVSTSEYRLLPRYVLLKVNYRF
ncbi:carboxypeptidase-like regulatory domain-containing protein [Aureivirga sp. CE67]|uniref:carboxypeptidase-like regulatory domain-containing protein n=1 Tax=Aureivirga sp. CE67 TaxID=1788983 RepID=UPI0018C9C40A|nr:carboxypeptidase-like regulatory domain-containing protein [Aureivirga sp. CE67]